MKTPLIRSLSPTSGPRGVTMLELMIVIAIMGIVATLTVPNLSAWLGRNRINNAAVHFARSIENARKQTLTQRERICMSFTGDSGFSNGNSSTYSIGVTVQQETAAGSQLFNVMNHPVELAGWTNDATSELYTGISLETGTTTSTFTLTSGCQGLLFNTDGYVANPASDFSFSTGSTTYAAFTLRNKNSALIEQRTVWLDRGGNTRISSGPTVFPN